MPKPNLLIVGCQKCGTTWLHRALSKHPKIFGSQVKELNYFNLPDRKGALEPYLANFPEHDGVEYYMESTPHYFRGAEFPVNVAGRIKAELDDAKLIVIFRNPVDRYESAYIHHVMQGRLPYESVIDKVIDDFSMLALGRYANVLIYWQKIFGSALKPLIYDDLRADPVNFAGQVFDHPDLDNPLTAKALDFRTNDKKQKMHKMSEPWDSIPVLSDRVRENLCDQYRPDVLKLGELMDRDLSHWT